MKQLLSILHSLSVISINCLGLILAGYVCVFIYQGFDLYKVLSAVCGGLAAFFLGLGAYYYVTKLLLWVLNWRKR